MKLRRGESRIVYFDADDNEIAREDMLIQVQGRSTSEGKAIVGQHRKETVQEWTDRVGNVVGRSYGNLVVAMEIKPADADARRADLLRRLREAQDRLSSPDATQTDMVEAMALQIEYLELMEHLND